MNILVVAMNYSPEQTGIGPFNAGLCEHLVSERHQVSVITTFPHYPEWRVSAAYRGKIVLRERINGVLVHRGYVYVPRKRTTVRRILYDSSVALSTFLWGLTIRDVDVILAISPPLQLDVAAYVLSKIKRATFLLQVQDLVPDIAIALGMLKNPVATKLAQRMERFVYRKARAIVVICKGFADNLKSKGVPGSKVLVLPNWANTDLVRPLNRSNKFRQQQNIDARTFLVLHAGNMGAKQRLENVLGAAEVVKKPGLAFLLVGDGSEKSRLEAYAKEKRLPNVRFLPLQAREILPPMLSAADVLVLNQSASIVDMVIPSKLLVYMASGRPVVAAVHESSEAGRLIRESDCGLLVPPEDARSMAKAIERLYEDRELGHRLGANGRSFAEEHFARNCVLQKYSAFFSQLEEEVTR